MQHQIDPKISIVMPVRNGAQFVSTAVQSILNQTFSDFEFLIIDDGSTDETPGILHTHAEGDPRIRLLRSAGAGIVDALNTGILASHAPLIARMDADDEAYPNRLRIQRATLLDSPRIIAVGSAATLIDMRGREIGARNIPTLSENIDAALLTGNPFLHPTMMYRRDVCIEAGLYRQACRHAEDYDLWLRLCERGTLVNLPRPLLNLRIHENQVSKISWFAQRVATALARQMARARQLDGSEPINLDQPLPAAACEYLGMVARDRKELFENETRDVETILRGVFDIVETEVSDSIIALLLRQSGLSVKQRLRFEYFKFRNFISASSIRI